MEGYLNFTSMMADELENTVRNGLGAKTFTERQMCAKPL